MKMTTDDFVRLESAIASVFTRSQHTAKHALNIYRENGLTLERFRWDSFHAACRSDTTLSHDLHLKYNDNHIGTALRKILPEDM